jgi:hypothetical protein
LTDLRALGVCGLLDLVGALLGEGNDEEAKEVVVGGLDDNVGFNQRLPLANQRPELVRGEVEAVEVGQAVLALDFVDSEFDLAERMVLVLLQIGERDFEYAALERIVGVFETGCAVDEGLSNAIARNSMSATILFIQTQSDIERDSTYSRLLKVDGALTEYQSFFAKGSDRFLRPFLPLERRLFLPTAMIATMELSCRRWCG